MDRRQFLDSLGIGAAFALTATCLQSCKYDVAPVTPDVTTTGTTSTANSFTINLDDASNAALKKNGGYVVVKNVVIAKDKDGNYVAATQICSHEGRKEVYYTSILNEFYCPAHGARFSMAGKGLNGNGSGGLKIYKTAIEGSLLRIYL